MGYVQHSMPAQTWTSSNIIFGLSSVMRVAPTSEPSHLLNLPTALVSLTNSRTASLKHLVNFVWTPPCPRALLPGYLDKSMPTCCTLRCKYWALLTKSILCPCCYHTSICQWHNWHLASFSGLMDQGLFGRSGDEHHSQSHSQPIQDQLNNIEYGKL